MDLAADLARKVREGDQRSAYLLARRIGPGVTITRLIRTASATGPVSLECFEACCRALDEIAVAAVDEEAKKVLARLRTS